MKKLISLTGDRPTGNLHIGHLIGSLNERINIQENYKSFVMIADAQAYTDHIKKREKVSNSILQVLEDYLSVGIDPSKTTIFLQSAIPEIQELSFYLSNFVTLSRIERIPTIRKEIFEKFTSPDKFSSEIPRNIPFGFMAYAISQSADILSFGADVVPVGRDQLPIIELANEISEIFNNEVGCDFFKKCQPITNEYGTITGIDGKSKMSKTLGNTIDLNSSNDQIVTKVKKMYTDPFHIKISDPGMVLGNTVFQLLDVFYNNKEHLNELKAHYQRGGLGDMTVKKILIDVLIEFFEPIQKRRAEINKDQLINILKEGTYNARSVATKTMEDTKLTLGLKLF